MKSFIYSQKLMLLLSAILIAVPFLIIKINLLSRNFIYSGKINDGLGIGAIDLVALRAEDKTTYTDKEGQFSLLIKRPLFWSGTKNIENLSIEAVPTFDFEGTSIKVPCALATSDFISTQVTCSTLLYPTVTTVASRVLATEINRGLFSATEIASRKSSLWDLLSEVSQKQWKNKEEFVDTLVSQETGRAKVKSQPIAYAVSRTTKKYSEYKYLGKIQVTGEIASVEASLTDASGKVSQGLMYFIKKDKIWRYLMPYRRIGVLF